MSPHAEEVVTDSYQVVDRPRIAQKLSYTRTPSSMTTTNGYTNGVSHGVTSEAKASEQVYDLVGVGFGPSNLALAVALHDAYDEKGQTRPTSLFVERQKEFGWHKGMLIPGARMQITFVKDFATLRNPRSHFTFLNYLFQKGRLASFTNLGTFLPQRREYEDYMRWCASHFKDDTKYGHEVVSVRPGQHNHLESFEVDLRDVESGSIKTVAAKKVVIAAGGAPYMPNGFPAYHRRIIHSSQYMTHSGDILNDAFGDYTIGIIGGGQSSAEIFNDLHSRYPNAKTRLILRGTALRPSDDSPFVNEIFDPDRVDTFYDEPADRRVKSLTEDRPTNYGVVRLPLLEHIYETLYMQKLDGIPETEWQHQILKERNITNCATTDDSVTLTLSNFDEGPVSKYATEEQAVKFDLVIVAAGYNRRAWETILEPVKHLRPQQSTSGAWGVKRDYSVELDRAKVNEDCGIYLSGCNELTHGLSDTLLSVLATRGGEMTDSMFGKSSTLHRTTNGAAQTA